MTTLNLDWKYNNIQKQFDSKGQVVIFISVHIFKHVNTLTERFNLKADYYDHKHTVMCEIWWNVINSIGTL